VYFKGRLLMSALGGYMSADRVGSVGTGSAYFPYGEEKGSPPTPTGIERFATYYRDFVGQDYADQRYYNSIGGRFLTPDPLFMSAANKKDPGSWNRYVYAGDDPVNRNDPSGLGSWMSTGQWTIPGSPPGFCGGGGDPSLAFLPAEVAGWMCPAFVPVAIVTATSSAPQPQCPLEAPTGNYTVAAGVVALFAPDMVAKIDAAFYVLNQEGIVPTITSGFRTAAGQLAQQGSPYGAAQVSWHQVGEAIDISSKVSSSTFQEIVTEMTADPVALTWGGTFNHKDPVHFQNAPVGTTPSPDQVAACAREHP
jgi:RHS repeat-associated protein